MNLNSVVSLLRITALLTSSYSQQDVPQEAIALTKQFLNAGNFAGSGYTDTELGPFYANGTYCDPKCNRDNICFSPVKPDKTGLKLILRNTRTINDPKGPDFVYTYKNGNEAASLLTPGRVVFLIHGKYENYQIVQSTNRSRDAWLSLEKDVNVFVVDWTLSDGSPVVNVPNVRIIGAMVGFFIKILNVFDRTRCDGFSSGAQICGEAGKWHQQYNRRKKIAICTGLDMGSMFFEGCDNEVKLDKTDCGVVTTIHTNNDPYKLSYIGRGNPENTGHCNYHFNTASGLIPFYHNRCGSEQPGCFSANPLAALTAFIQNVLSQPNQINLISVICEHLKAVDIYASQVLNSSCQLVGHEFLNPDDCRPYHRCDGKGPFKPTLMAVPPNDDCQSSDFKVILVRTGLGPGERFCSRPVPVAR